MHENCRALVRKVTCSHIRYSEVRRECWVKKETIHKGERVNEMRKREDVVKEKKIKRNETWALSERRMRREWRNKRRRRERKGERSKRNGHCWWNGKMFSILKRGEGLGGKKKIMWQMEKGDQRWKWENEGKRDRVRKKMKGESEMYEGEREMGWQGAKWKGMMVAKLYR